MFNHWVFGGQGLTATPVRAFGGQGLTAIPVRGFVPRDEGGGRPNEFVPYIGLLQQTRCFLPLKSVLYMGLFG